MADTMRRHAPVRPSRYIGVVTPEQLLGARIGRTAESAHQLLYSPFRGGLTLPELTAACIEAFQAARAFDRLVRWEGPIVRAQLGSHAGELTGALLHQVEELELVEELRENDYRLAANTETAARWVAAIDKLVAGLLRVRAAIVTKHHVPQ